MIQDDIAIAYIESTIKNSKKSTILRITRLFMSIFIVVFGMNIILSVSMIREDSIFDLFFMVAMFLLFIMIVLETIKDVKYVIISHNIEKYLNGILEYEIACAENNTSWRRFVFAHCLSKFFEEKPESTYLLFSGSNSGINIILEDKIIDYTVPAVWHLLCQKNFNDNNISIFDNFTYEIATFYLKENKLKLLYYSMSHDDYQIYSIPTNFSSDFIRDIIFGNFITIAINGWKNLELRTAEKNLEFSDYRKFIKSYLELLPR